MLRDACRRRSGASTSYSKFKSIGEVGADIFFREAQRAWDELYPFADKKALAAAEKLGLGDNARALARLVDRKDLPRLLAALVRADLNKELEDIVQDATQ